MEYPGRLYVAATLLPLVSFLAIILAGALRCALRSAGQRGPLYHALGGDRPVRAASFVATGAIALAFALSLIGFVQFIQTAHPRAHGVSEGRPAQPAEAVHAPL